MISACMDWMASFWKWLNESQLASTLIILVCGTFIYETWHKHRAVRRELIWWLINHIEEYTSIANDYWTNHPSAKAEHQMHAARLKSEYSVMLTTIDDLSMKKAIKKQIREALINLYEAATGGSFESQRKVSQENKLKVLSSIATHSAALRRNLRACVI